MSGSHRARWTLRAIARAAAGPSLALAAVGALIGLLVLLNGRPDLDAGPVVQPPSTSIAEPSTLGDSGPVTPTPAPTPTSTPAPVPTPTPTPTTAAPARAPLTVLNNSTISGLAASAADRFRAGGWSIAAVGNFTGRVATTTVYYAPGQQAVAAALAAQFPDIARVRPRFAGLPGSGLTVVVTRDFPH